LDHALAARRGDVDFAYFFTSGTSPKDLGEAIAKIARPASGTNLDDFRAAYALGLADLAGTVALATQDGDLSTSWTHDFVAATTVAPGGGATQEQQAVKQNLLLLLSRGQWSADFLGPVVKAFWDFDTAYGTAAWPVPAADDVRYAQTPDGTYLTDGMLALTAALTANPEAAASAFTDVQPGTEPVRFDSHDYAISRFTYHLLREHQFPKSVDNDDKGSSVGVSAVLTALSSAMGSAPGEAVTAQQDGGLGPDAALLQAMAKASTDGGNFFSRSLRTLEQWVGDLWDQFEHWDHRILDILTFAPPPFGVVAAVSDAAWYGIDGDYADAGLSLAAVAPGLAFAKIGKEAKAGAEAEKTAREVDVATAEQKIRAGLAEGTTLSRPNLPAPVKAQIEEAAEKTPSGDFKDPNTGKIIPKEGPFHYGHKPGYEWRCIRDEAIVQGWTNAQLVAFATNPAIFQIEDPSSNQSHEYEAETCAV
jgi:hypothetical protein